MRHAHALAVLACLFAIDECRTVAAADPTLTEARDALSKAVGFFRREVSVSGGCLWQYSADLSLREGEGVAGPQMVWVQPPGTPSLGDAYLDAYRWTRDEQYLAAARETGGALVNGQLPGGGWDYRIEFDRQRRSAYAYRVDGGKGKRNVVTLDDNTTQAALRFLMRLDETLQFKDREIHGCVTYALDGLLAAQYPNGAWPQRFSGPPDPRRFPVRKASYPDSWPRKYPKLDYREYYTFNDNTIADVIDVMFEASEIYGEERFSQAAERAGDFILLAQLPAPQPAWAQQYDRQMHPAWARRFEPASVTGGESQGVMQALLDLYVRTGKRKYLDAVSPALEYLKRSRLDDGRLARFYELKTNRPLYFTKQYELVYHAKDLPTHYGFIVGSKLDRIERRLVELQESKYLPPPTRRPDTWRREKLSKSLARAAAKAIGELDSRGAWVEAGRLKYHPPEKNTTAIINVRTYYSNMATVARYIAALQAQ
ncbi:MAG: pectate lyase [Pirellulaceae bacterium]|jgi:hypothetical protein|nr:pectate lyase [Pirellulaceae bacterium]MDP7018485.1 pectate lyase [Pirellulaceae bacterium]